MKNVIGLLTLLLISVSNGQSCAKVKDLEGANYKSGIKFIEGDFGQSVAAYCDEHGESLNIMVATNGGGSDHTEVITTGPFATCRNLPARYPHFIESAFVMRRDSKMVICGGNPTPEDRERCYRYSDNQWIYENYKLNPPRAGAMAVEIRSGEWFIMGGIGNSFQYIRNTQFFKNGTFRKGPDLPEPIHGGSAVMLNKTHLFVVASDNGSRNISPKNYFLNINEQKWTRIADRKLEPSWIHSSGTFYNSTIGELQIATIGFYGIEVYSPSNDSWHRFPFPSPLRFLARSVAIQLGTDSFILIGGWTQDGFSGHVYLFDDKNGLSILKRNVLHVARSLHVAMPISKQDFDCE